MTSLGASNCAVLSAADLLRLNRRIFAATRIFAHFSRMRVYSRSISAGESAVQNEIKSPGASGYAVPTADVVVKQLDLEDLLSVQRLADEVQREEGRIDFLVLNAGILAGPLRCTHFVCVYPSQSASLRVPHGSHAASLISSFSFFMPCRMQFVCLLILHDAENLKRT